MIDCLESSLATEAYSILSPEWCLMWLSIYETCADEVIVIDQKSVIRIGSQAFLLMKSPDLSDNQIAGSARPEVLEQEIASHLQSFWNKLLEAELWESFSRRSVAHHQQARNRPPFPLTLKKLEKLWGKTYNHYVVTATWRAWAAVTLLKA